MKHFQYLVMDLGVEEFRTGHQNFGGNIISPPTHLGSYFMIVVPKSTVWSHSNLFRPFHRPSLYCRKIGKLK